MPSVCAWAAIWARKLRASATGSGSGAAGGSLETLQLLSFSCIAACWPPLHSAKSAGAQVELPPRQQQEVRLGGTGSHASETSGTPQCLKEYASTLRSSSPSTVLGRDGHWARGGPSTQLMKESRLILAISSHS